MATMAVISFVVLAMSDCASAFFSYITSPPECMTIALAALVSGASDTAYARAENAANSAAITIKILLFNNKHHP